MRVTMKRLLALTLAAVLGASLLCVPAVAEEAQPEHTLWIVGDSTSCDFGTNDNAYYYPRFGYGTQVDKYLDGVYAVRNLAASGTSSLSFRTDKQEAYEELLAGMKAGDALLIAFGHNDEKTEEARYTDPSGDYQTPGSFAESLYTYYIKPAREAGAEVVLCTPIVRRRATDESWSDNQLHLTSPSGDFPGGDYPKAIRDLGKALEIPVVDLTAATKTLYEELGAAETEKLHARQAKEGVDNTHLNLYGAQVVARLLAEGLKTAGMELSKHVEPAAFTPDVKQVTVGPEYVELSAEDYTPPTADSALFADYVAGEAHFKGTAFGQLGGEPSLENHVLETDASGNMHMAVKNNKGKIASSEDGLVMYYYQIPVGKQFKLSAKVTVNALGEKNLNQIAFGLMARDDMYVDTHRSPGFNSNYVVAGTFGNGSTNCFYRKGGALSDPVPLTVETVAVGKRYDLSIVSNTDGFACAFGAEPGQSQGYDFDLNAVDTQYFYVGMFAARNTDVTYSDICLEIDGQVVADTRGAAAPQDGRKFADVPPGHWAEVAINSMVDKGVIQGVDETLRRFAPDAAVDRAGIVTMLYRLAGTPDASGQAPFADVGAGQWYTGAVSWGKETGVVTGYGDYFYPQAPLTREQLAVMLYRYAGAQGGGEPMTGFADSGQVSDWAWNAVYWAASQGILNGKPGNRLDPQGTASRAEAVVMLQRFVELV